MAIEIHRAHHLDQAASRQLVEALAEELAEDLNLRYHWEGDRMVFRRPGAHGHIEVEDGEVRIYVKKNAFVPISESWIREQIEAHLNEHLGPR
jgi:putative polyhydroxyalkanoate system protein